MNSDKFSSDIKTALNSSHPADSIKRQLQSRRIQILDQAEVKKSPWAQTWLLPAASALAILMAVILIVPTEQNEFAEMAELSAEELEIMSTMDIEDIEELEFYNWLDLQEGLTG